MKILSHNKTFLRSFIVCLVILTFAMPAFAATTEVHIVKYANDRSTVLSEKTMTYQQMKDTIPVLGDGTTHYYHQGPVFLAKPEDRWNPKEDTNVQEKDMGAVKGTNLKDLCDLVGGMSSGDTLVIKASDGMSKEFAYKNVYGYSSREGPIGLTWFMNGEYPDSGYSDGMRLVWFADTGVNPWGIHAFGNYDWHQSADSKYWYYYMDGPEKYPTTTGLSVKYVSEIQIYSSSSSASSSAGGGGTGLPLLGAASPVNPDLNGYKGKKLNTFKAGTLNGSVRFFSDLHTQPVIIDNRIKEFNLSVDLPPGSNITLARMYLYISESHNLQTHKGVTPSFYGALDAEELKPDKVYMDNDGDDNAQIAATYTYDIRELIGGNGNYHVSIRNLNFEDSEFSVDGLLLVTVYENETAPGTSFWIDEGCDVISSLPEKGLLPDDCETSYAFSGTVNMSTIGNASLYLVSTGLDQNITTEHEVRFNQEKWYNIFNNQSTSLLVNLPIRTYLNETFNNAYVRSTIRSKDADYLVNRNVILVVEHQEPNFSAIIENASMSAQSMHAPLNDVIKERLTEMPEDPDVIRYGGLAINSRPNGPAISIDGISTGKNTPSVIMGLEAGRHTIKLTGDNSNKETSDFTFEEQTVQVVPGLLILADFNGIGNNALSDVIIDSHHYRGLNFTVNGYPLYATVPEKARLARFDSYVTIRENESFVSHQIPTTLNQDRYVLISPRDYQNFSISVGSNPQGAEVFIDGFRTGYTTPSIIGNISDGPHRIMVTKDGYLPQQRLVDLPNGADPLYHKSVDFVLNEYQSGYLYVNSIPEGGKVSIDNLFTGEVTPALFKSVPIGNHAVKVDGVNTSKTFDATVTSLEMTNLTADFTPREES